MYVRSTPTLCSGDNLGYFKDITNKKTNFISEKREFNSKKIDKNKVVMGIFKSIINEDNYTNSVFVKFGIIKISRSEFQVLDTSYFIKVIDSSKDLNEDNLKIYSLVHGRKGILGEGTMKRAKYAVEIKTGEKLVISRFKKGSPRRIEQLYPEMLLALEKVMGLSNISGGTYIRVYSYSKNRECPVILSQFAETTLFNVIQNKPTQSEKIKYTKELLAGLKELHKKDVVHRDIKPENINIINGIAHLSDLDFALISYDPNQTAAGTPIYTAPETFKGECNNIADLKKSDVYQLGITLFELYSGFHPWYDRRSEMNQDNLTETMKDNIDKINENKFNLLLSMNGSSYATIFAPPKVDTLEYLIWEMKHLDPNVRPTAQQALDRLNAILSKTSVASIKTI